MAINKSDFGTTKDGKKASKFILKNKKGNYIVISDYGCTVLSICLHDKRDVLTDVCLGYNSLTEYEEHDEYLGACIGRFAGGIDDGIIKINGRSYLLAKNNGQHHLHGGVKGFDKYVWDYKVSDNAVIFCRTSPDMEEGYPGTLRLIVSYEFTDNNEMIINYYAVSDQDTILNMTNHTYYNLSGESEGTILDHTLQVFAGEYSENNSNNIASEIISPLKGTVFDFQSAKIIGKDIGQKNIQLEYSGGYDHNYYLGQNNIIKHASRLSSPKSGITMDIFTDQTGIQVYTGNSMKGYTGKSGTVYGPRSAVCLETQYCPSAEEGKHHKLWPVLKSDELYHYYTRYYFHI